MLKKFDPELAKTGIEVRTKDNRKVRIICYDAKSGGRDDDIVALVLSEKGAENICRYYSDGQLISGNPGCNMNLALYYPDPDLKEEIITILKKASDVYSIYGEDCEFQKYAQEIITLLPKWHKFSDNKSFTGIFTSEEENMCYGNGKYYINLEELENLIRKDEDKGTLRDNS